MPDDLLSRCRQRARLLVALHHPTAETALLAGSIPRGEGTPTSDIDLVVLHHSLVSAWRHTVPGTPVTEIFVHDIDSLALFIEKDRARGIPSLISMVREGEPLQPSPKIAMAKDIAETAFSAGPHPLSREDLLSRRYGITDLLDDLAGGTDPDEIRAIGARLYFDLGDFHRRANGRWSAGGKHLPRLLRREHGDTGVRLLAAFERLFGLIDPTDVIRVAQDVLAPFGGTLHTWHSEAPPHRMAEKIATSP